MNQIELFLDQRAGTPLGDGNGRFFMFSEYIRAPRGSVLTLALQSVTIPLTHWVINDFNNTLAIRYSAGEVDVQTITFANGNKTIDSVVALLNTQLQFEWQAEYDFDTNQVVFSLPIGGSLTVSMTIEEGTTCGELLGFVVGDSSSGTTTLRSRGIDLSGDTCFYVNSNLRTSNVRPFSGGDVSVLGRVPITRGTNDVERWSNYTNYINQLSVDFLSGIFIEILDDKCERPIEFHGGYWTVSLVFGNVEEENPRLLYAGEAPPSDQPQTKPA